MKNDKYELKLGDTLERMKEIPDGSINMILCDLPYGTTRLKWDSPVNLDTLWLHYERLITDKGAIVLCGNQPFTSHLIMKMPSLYRYSWIWVKPFPTGFLNANYRPMLAYEDVAVFSKSGAGAGSKDNNMTYNPQGLVAVNKIKKNKKGSRGRQIHETVNCGTENCLNSEKEYEQKWTGYPTNVLHFERDSPQIHPTQKPIALMEYLVNTYTNEGQIVLDNTMGSGTTGVACMNLNRKFIGIERDEEYFKICEERIRNAYIKSFDI